MQVRARRGVSHRRASAPCLHQNLQDWKHTPFYRKRHTRMADTDERCSRTTEPSAFDLNRSARLNLPAYSSGTAAAETTASHRPNRNAGALQGVIAASLGPLRVCEVWTKRGRKGGRRRNEGGGRGERDKGVCSTARGSRERSGSRYDYSRRERGSCTQTSRILVSRIYIFPLSLPVESQQNLYARG